MEKSKEQLAADLVEANKKLGFADCKTENPI